MNVKPETDSIAKYFLNEIDQINLMKFAKITQKVSTQSRER